MVTSKQTAPAAPAYTKAQLLASKKYRDRRDLLNALLGDERQYTGEQVGTLIEAYMKDKVK